MEWTSGLNGGASAIEDLGPPSMGVARDYSLYGLHVRSSVPLRLQEVAAQGSADVEFLPEAPSQFADAVSQVVRDDSAWIHQCELTGSWSYVRYDEMFDFLVAPAGDRIFFRLLGPLSIEAFQTYALGRVMSFALVKMGHEPLHAAAIVVDGRAVAFLGASTFGKSSLAACFVAANYPLLTDDVLRLEERGGGFVAFAGPPRLKLFPKVARIFLADRSHGLQMNPQATKLVFPLSAPHSSVSAVPLAAIYVLAAPRDTRRNQPIHVEPHPPLDALLKVLSFTHNHQLRDRSRLERQFAAARRLVDVVPVRRLSYPRRLASLPDVREAVLADLQRSSEW